MTGLIALAPTFAKGIVTVVAATILFVGTVYVLLAWLDMLIGVVALAALALGVWGLVSRRSRSSSQG